MPPQVTYSRERSRLCSAGQPPGPVGLALQAIQGLEGAQVALRGPDLRLFLLYLHGEDREEGWRAALVQAEGWKAPSLALLPASQRLQGVWLAWAAAHSTLTAKLRTPMGKAQETLGHLAECAKRLAALPVAQLELGPATALLAFVRSLEKCMVNSWDGSVTALPPATKSTQLFFWANRATCQAWLGGIRPTLLALAYSAGEYGEVVRQAGHLLPALARRGAGELEQGPGGATVLYTALALARLDSPHGLAGLQVTLLILSGCLGVPRCVCSVSRVVRV